jgi:hypothetical protein
VSKRKPRRHVKAVRRSRRTASHPDAPFLLGAVAASLNACEKAGISLKLAHGTVITEYGYIFPVGPDTAPWAVSGEED